MALVDGSGAAIERYVYDPYGRATVLKADWSLQEVEGQPDGTASAYANEILYGGYRFDPETGLYHVRHRVYHVTLGRWMQRDPLGYVDGMSLYEYVKSAPPVRTDAMGLQGAEPLAVMIETGELAALPDGVHPAYAWMDEHNVGTRLVGVGKVVGGLVEGVVGCAITFGSGGLLGAAGGFQMWVHGADVADAALGHAWSGENTETQTHAAVRDLAQKAGAEPAVAAQIADYADAGLSAVNVSVGAALVTPKTIETASKTLAGVGDDLAGAAGQAQTGSLRGNTASGAPTEARSSFNYRSKIEGQIGRRGWSDSLIDETISSPYATSPATNKATGGGATAYFRQDGSYVVRDNVSKEIIQVSNRNDLGWIPDPAIQNPYRPK